MQLRRTLPACPGKRRTAFTLIELLVVIAIIAILSALSAAAVIKYMGTQQINVAQQRVNTVSSQMNKAWKSVAQNAMRDDLSKYPPAVIQWATLPGSGLNPALAKVIYVKCALKQAFPMNFNEALNPFPMPPLPAYKSYLNSLGITASSGAAYESSACLLMALQRGVSSMSLNMEDLGVGATSDFPAGNSTIKALVDPWGQPLIFCRWPTGSTLLNPGGPQPGFNDPGDPQGYLTNATWLSNAALSGPFQTNLHLLPSRAAGAPATSYKLMPLVASSGPDRLPGYQNAYPFTMGPDGTGADNDNIYPQ